MRFVAGNMLTFATRKIFLVSIALAIGLPAVSGHASEPMPSSEQLLHDAADSIRWTDHYSSVTKIRYQAKATERGRQFQVGGDSRVTKYQDGDRLRLIYDYGEYLTPNGEVVKETSRKGIVLTPEGRTGWWSPANEPLRGTAQVAKAPEKIKEMRLIDECDSHSAAFLDGYVDGLGNVIDLAIAGVLAPNVKHEQIGDVDCSIVESRSKDTLMKLWIASAKQNLVVKYLVEQGDGPTGAMRAEFQASGYQTIDGKTFVRAGQSNKTWVEPDTHGNWSETVDAERVDLNLRPDFDKPGLFTTSDVPNGVRVFIEELRDVGVDFIWSNGRPIAKIDIDLFSELGKSVQQTMAGKVSDAIPITPVVESEKIGDGGEQRFKQLWIALLGSAMLGAFLLIGLGMKRRNIHALK